MVCKPSTVTSSPRDVIAGRQCRHGGGEEPGLGWGKGSGGVGRAALGWELFPPTWTDHSIKYLQNICCSVHCQNKSFSLSLQPSHYNQYTQCINPQITHRDIYSHLRRCWYDHRPRYVLDEHLQHTAMLDLMGLLSRMSWFGLPAQRKWPTLRSSTNASIYGVTKHATVRNLRSRLSTSIAFRRGIAGLNWRKIAVLRAKEN